MSLTCICCKTLEHIIVSNINKHLAFEGILADCQHGFRSQRSCETHLVHFYYDLVSNIIVSNINTHIAFESILADCQHGFRSQRSCETQLVPFYHDLVSNSNRALNRDQKQTDMIIMDFAKAFVRVPHRRLLY